MATNYAIQLATGAYISCGSAAALENASALHGKFKVLGDKLNAITGSFQTVGFDYVGKSGGSDWKVIVGFFNSFGSLVPFIDLGGGTGLEGLNNGISITPSTFDPSLYYVVEWHADASQTNKLEIKVFQADGTTQISGTATASGNPFTALPTGAGYGCHIVNSGQAAAGIGADTAGTFDFAYVGTSISDLGASVLDIGVPPDTSGSTTVIDSGTDAKNGAITGTFTWIPLVVPDHGIITLTPDTVVIGGTGTATVDWKDAGGVSLVPQPSTTWAVVGNGATINTATGVYTGAAAGTATIQATASTVNATATLIISRHLTFSGSVTAT